MRFFAFVVGSFAFEKSDGASIRGETENLFVRWIRGDLGLLEKKVESNFVTYLAIYDWERRGSRSILKEVCKVDWEGDSAGYKSVLENLLFAAHFLPRKTISGSEASLCLLGHILAGSPPPLRGEIQSVLRKFWRNLLAERFVKYGPYLLDENYDVADTSPGGSIFAMGEKLDSLYLLLLDRTGSALPQSVERKFFQFVKEASKTFDFDKVWKIWTEIDPFNRDNFSPKFDISADPPCAVGGVDPPRISPQMTAWETIQRVSLYRHTWDETLRKKFCSVVHEFDQALSRHSSWANFQLIEDKRRDFDGGGSIRLLDFAKFDAIIDAHNDANGEN